MSALNQVIAGIGGVVVDSWTFVGAGTIVERVFASSYTVNFPATAQAGDLAVLCGGGANDGITPSGWTRLAAGNSLTYFKVCAGGEASVTITTNTANSRTFQMLLFRPVGGAATFTGSSTEVGSPPVAASAITYTALPSVFVAVANGIDGSGAWLGTIPALNFATQTTNAVSPVHLFGYALIPSGSNTGSLQIYPTNIGGGSRQTFGVFHLA